MSIIEVAWLLDDVAIRIIRMSDSGHLERKIIYAAVTLVIVLVSIREGSTNLYDVVDLVVNVHTTGVTLELIILQHTVVVHHGECHVEVCLVRTTVYVHLIVLSETVLENHIHPIGVGTVLHDVVVEVQT